MKTFLLCCLWAQGWIGGRTFGAMGWLWSLIAERHRPLTGNEPNRHSFRRDDPPGIP